MHCKDCKFWDREITFNTKDGECTRVNSMRYAGVNQCPQF